MKKLRIIFAVLLAGTAVSLAQGPIGLMVSETAARKSAGSTVLAGGVTIGDNSEFYGGRLSGAVSEQVTLFGDVGIADFDNVEGSDPGVQMGAIVNLPADVPVDLAARGAFATAFFDDVDYYSLSGMLLASKDLTTDVRGLSLYGGVGLFYWNEDREIGGPPGSDHHVENDDTELALAVGAILDVTDRLDLYIEFNEVDDSFLGGGVRWAL